jgi:SlyX protein
MTDSPSVRLDRLEAHIAHQELAIEELNEVVLSQRDEIERLTRRLNKLTGRIDALEEQAPPPENRPPPHY